MFASVIAIGFLFLVHQAAVEAQLIGTWSTKSRSVLTGPVRTHHTFLIGEVYVDKAADF
jgi:hypothetical protein